MLSTQLPLAETLPITYPLISYHSIILWLSPVFDFAKISYLDKYTVKS